jgi:type IV pilus assembly protein PilM
LFDKEVVSIDIGSQNIKVAVGKQQGNSIVIGSAFLFLTPVNAIQDGKILEMDKLTEAIRRAFHENAVKAKKAILTIESTSIIRREMDLPAVKPEELDTMVRYEAEQYLPIVMSDYIIEYKIIDEYTEEQVKKYKILLAALPKALAEDFLTLIRGLPLTPAVLDIHSNAISKLFSQKGMINGGAYHPDKTIAVLDMGFNSINLTVVSKGSTRFSRLIGSGGYDIDINVTNTFNLDMKQAEEKKKKEVDIVSAASDPLDAMLNESVKGTVESWMTEIQRMFQYYTSRESKNTIDEIYIYGGSSNLKGLADYMKAVLNLPVYQIKSFGNVKLSKQSSIPIEFYVNAVGAIMRK